MRIDSLDNPPRKEWPGLCSEEEYFCWASLSPKDTYLAQIPRETPSSVLIYGKVSCRDLGLHTASQGHLHRMWGRWLCVCVVLLFDLCFPWFFWKCLQGAAGLTFQLVELFSTAAITRGGAGIQGAQKFFCLVVTPGLLSFPYISGQRAGATDCCCSLLIWKSVWLLKLTPFSSPLTQVHVSWYICLNHQETNELPCCKLRHVVCALSSLFAAWGWNAAVISSALERISFRKWNFIGWGE